MVHKLFMDRISSQCIGQGSSRKENGGQRESSKKCTLRQPHLSSPDDDALKSFLDRDSFDELAARLGREAEEGASGSEVPDAEAQQPEQDALPAAQLVP